MKIALLKNIFLVAFLLFNTVSAIAYDCEVNGICYTRTSTSEVKVTYKSGYYSGDIVIPETIVFNGKTFTVTSIDDKAFMVCRQLTSVSLPKTIKTFGRMSFKGCVLLTSITFPQDFESYSQDSFEECTSLSNIYVDENNQKFRDIDGVLYSKDGTKLILCPMAKAQHTIVDGITSIEKNAFKGCAISSKIVIPSSVVSIGEGAFEACSNIEEIIIPNSVTTIEKKNFNGMNNLKSITLPDNLTRINSYLVSGCPLLTSIKIPENVTFIDGSAFSRNSGITEITIPNNVETIWDGSFSDCTSLTTLRIGTGLKTVGCHSFDNCTKLYEIYCYPMTPPNYRLFTTKISSEPFEGVDKNWCTLYVPKGTISLYKHSSSKHRWGDFLYIEEFDASAVSDCSVENEKTKAVYYDIIGRKYTIDNYEKLPKGLYIISGKKIVRN